MYFLSLGLLINQNFMFNDTSQYTYTVDMLNAFDQNALTYDRIKLMDYVDLHGSRNPRLLEALPVGCSLEDKFRILFENELKLRMKSIEEFFEFLSQELFDLRQSML